MSVLDWVLCGLLVVQQIFYMWQVAKLTDRIMSRSFAEYQQAKQKAPLKIMVPTDNAVPEDFGPLGEFQIV